MILALFALGLSGARRPVAPQTLGDPTSARFVHGLEARRTELLRDARHAAALRFLNLSRNLLAAPGAGSGEEATLLLGLQEMADSIAYLEAQLREAEPAARGAREALATALQTEAEALRERCSRAPPTELPALQTRLSELQREIASLRVPPDRDASPDPLEEADEVLRRLLPRVREARLREERLERLRDALGRFQGELRLFDEMGLPPGARIEEGSGSDPGCGCGIPVPEEVGPPTDLSVVDPTAAGEGEGVGGAGALRPAAESLAALEGWLRSAPDSFPWSPVGATGWGWSQRGEGEAGLLLRTFRGGGEESSGLGAKLGGGAHIAWRGEGSVTAALEPRLGVRAFLYDRESATEGAVELRETLAGRDARTGVGWWVMALQKGRLLSGGPLLEGSLEPDRGGGALLVRVAVPLSLRWSVEMGGEGEGVRYGEKSWSVLDHQGGGGGVHLVREDPRGALRLSAAGSRAGFPADSARGRRDDRWRAALDWSREGRMVTRFSLGTAWNDSNLPAYDFLSLRAGFLFSAPLGDGSLQAYGVLSRKAYRNPGPEEARVAPSDQDTGSVLALQLAIPLDAARTVRIRGEWSRSETGFRNRFFQRIGLGILVGFGAEGRELLQPGTDAPGSGF